jgi:hypothetical protein
MAVTPERTQKRHVREKAIVDHLAENVYNPKPSAEKHASKIPPQLPACRLRIRSARNGILVRVAFPRFDNPGFYIP